MNIAKLVSEAWKKLPPEERELWEERARKDKARYEIEKSLYDGPWKVPARARTPKNPDAPKRPMSAFLAFSNKRRATVKAENPDASNAELSKILSRKWKEAPEDVKKTYVDEEAELRQKYHEAMAEWRRKEKEAKILRDKEREDRAMEILNEVEHHCSENTGSESLESTSEPIRGRKLPPGETSISTAEIQRARARTEELFLGARQAPGETIGISSSLPPLPRSMDETLMARTIQADAIDRLRATIGVNVSNTYRSALLAAYAGGKRQRCSE